MLFYGPPGNGKKTLIMAVLRQMFGAGAEKVGFFLPLLHELYFLLKLYFSVSLKFSVEYA